jgi:TetR/AcrR family transcriptional regulator
MTNANTSEQKANRRDSIVQAAAELFGQRGFEGTSISAVAERAGVKKSLAQYHFESKEVLWRETVQQVWQQRNDALPRYLDGLALNSDDTGKPAQMVRDLCKRLLCFTFDHPEWVKIMFQEASTPGPRLDWMVDEFLKADFFDGRAMVELAQSHHLLPKVDAMDLLHILSGALIYLVSVAPITERVLGVEANSDAYAEHHIDTLMAILAPALKH